jgi:hypothetical protein
VRTLQHHGDNALAAVRALAGAQLPQTSPDNAVWFDVLGFGVIWWPEPWSLWIGIVALLLSIGAIARSRDFPAAAIGAIGTVTSIVAIVLVALIISFLASLRATGATWVAKPFAMIAAAWIAGLAVPAIVIPSISRGRPRHAIVAGVAFVWSALAIAVAIILPGASYLFAVPAVMLGVLALAEANPVLTAILCTSVSGVLFFPFGFFLYEALGRPGLLAVAALVGFVATTYAAMSSAPKPVAYAASAVTVLLILAALLPPPYTHARPRRLNLLYLDEPEHHWWVAASTRPDLLPGLTWSSRVLAPWNANPGAVQVTPAPDQYVQPVSLRVTKTAGFAGSRRFHFELQSVRKADRVLLAIHSTSAIHNLRVNGVTPPPPTGRFPSGIAPDWHRVVARGSSAVIEADIDGENPVDIIYADYSYGLPPQSRPLASARDAWPAVPSDDGDMTVTMRRMRI